MRQEDLKQISGLMDQKFEKSNKKIFEKIDILDKKINGLDSKIDSKIDGLDKKIDSKIDELALVTKQGFDEVENRLNNAENDMCAVKKDLKHVKDCLLYTSPSPRD